MSHPAEPPRTLERPIAAPPAAESRALLASTRLFGCLPAAALDEIGAQLEWWLVPGGATLCHQGEVSDGLYLVSSGRLVVVRGFGDQETVIGQKGRGDSLGEVSILTRRPRSASFRALRDTVVARLSRARTEAVLRRYPDVLFEMTRLLASWLRAEPQVAAQGCVAVAITAAGPEVPLTDFTDRLAVTLGGMVSTMRVTARDVDARLGTGAACCPDGSQAHGALAAWLTELESAHDVVLYEADTAPTEWTRRCLRQADHILVVARAESAPSLGAVGD